MRFVGDDHPVIAAGEALADEVGFPGLTMGLLAERLGVRKSQRQVQSRTAGPTVPVAASDAGGWNGRAQPAGFLPEAAPGGHRSKVDTMSTTAATRQSVAIVVYEDAAKDLARAYRGLLTAKEFVEAGDDVVVVYDGSGVDTLSAAADPGHALHRLVEQLRPHTRGACGFCARAHGVEASLTGHDWPLLSDYKGHASVRQLILDGYHVLPF